MSDSEYKVGSLSALISAGADEVGKSLFAGKGKRQKERPREETVIISEKKAKKR